jgi:hypothetical protein
MSIKTVSISELDAQGSKATNSIWCINTADQSELRVMGEIKIAVPKRNGQGNPDVINVAQTWLPQELTRDVERRRLLAASEFRHAVSAKLISLVTEDTANRILKQPHASEEQQRLDAQRAHMKKAGAARTIADSNATIARADGVKDDDDDSSSGLNKTVIIDHSDDDTKSVAQLAANGVEDYEPGISSQFKMWVDRLNTGSDVGAKNEIKARRSFSKAELRFLASRLNKKFVSCKAMVEKNLGSKG